MALDLRPGERVYQEIKQTILSGDFALQQRLDIDRLAAQFGVSATPVRQALAILSAERLVRMHASRTYHVAFWSERELRELYEWRHQLAKWAVETYQPASPPPSTAQRRDYVASYLALMQHLDANTNTELRRAARAADDRLHAALRAEGEALGDGAADIARIDAALSSGGAALIGALRKHFKRRIAQCALVRSTAHANAMPRNDD